MEPVTTRKPIIQSIASQIVANMAEYAGLVNSQVRSGKDLAKMTGPTYWLRFTDAQAVVEFSPKTFVVTIKWKYLSDMDEKRLIASAPLPICKNEQHEWSKQIAFGFDTDKLEATLVKFLLPPAQVWQYPRLRMYQMGTYPVDIGQREVALDATGKLDLNWPTPRNVRMGGRTKRVARRCSRSRSVSQRKRITRSSVRGYTPRRRSVSRRRRG